MAKVLVGVKQEAGHPQCLSFLRMFLYTNSPFIGIIIGGIRESLLY